MSLMNDRTSVRKESEWKLSMTELGCSVTELGSLVMTRRDCMNGNDANTGKANVQKRFF